ncbi:hypothetical protein ACWGJT_31950 [Streptomyces xantholiticus]
MAADAAFLYLDRSARRPLDPGFAAAATSFRVRTLPLGGGQLVVPRSSGLIASLPAANHDLAKARVADCGGPWVEAASTPGKSMAQVAASRFRWDADSKKAGPLPQPLLPDEALIIYWPDQPPQGPLLPTALDGISEDDAATHLLASSNTARDGELERTLLRAPAVGLVRFERYRHLALRAGKLEVAQPSATGAWVLQLPPGGITIPTVLSPLEDPRTLVWEHVAIDHAIDCTARIVTLHLLRLPDVLASEKFRPAVLAQMSWLFRSWLAWLRVIAPVEQPASPDPTPNIPAAIRTPFEGAAAANRARVEAMAGHVLSDQEARTSLLDFVTSYYAPLLCGRSWSELGVDLPIEPATRPAALVQAHRTLEHLPHSSQTWLLAFAGCPLGRPGRVYEPRTPPAPAPPRPLSCLTTFDLEAAAIAGLTTAEYPDVQAPDVTDPLEQVDLSGFAGDSSGVLAMLRAVDADPPHQEFTTYDWLAEVVKGAGRSVRQSPEVDFADYAAGGHPLASPLRFAQYQDAVELHTRMGRLNAARIGGSPLAAATIAWWSTTTGLRDGAGTWPAYTVTAGDTRVLAGPSAPYKASTTLNLPSPIPYGTNDGESAPNTPRVTGFDEFDIEAVLRAAKVVRNGKTLATDLDPALFLALIEREGFRASASGERLGTVREIVDAFPPGVRGLAHSADHIGVMAWLFFPFGLDMVVLNKPAQKLPFANAGFVSRSRDNFRDHFLLRLTAEGLLDPAVDPLVDWETALRYLNARRPGSWPPRALHHATVSRTALWMGFAIQQATFQWVHRLLSQATTPPNGTPPAGGNPYVQVPELMAPPPAVGANATTEQRRRYIAYWALVYLAFNVLESTWNAWVKAVPAPVIAAGTSISEYLVYHHNAAPDALDPPGGLPRLRGHRGNMVRFAAALDSYLRLAYGAATEDTTDPAARTWPAL